MNDAVTFLVTLMVIILVYLTCTILAEGIARIAQWWFDE